MTHVYAAVVHCSDKLEETLLYKHYCIKKIKTFLENGIKNRIFAIILNTIMKKLVFC